MYAPNPDRFTWPAFGPATPGELRRHRRAVAQAQTATARIRTVFLSSIDNATQRNLDRLHAAERYLVECRRTLAEALAR